jgi:transmembrane sensor
MLRREAATWLARLQSGGDPDVERKFRRWHDADPRNAAAFERIGRTYDQAAVLRHSAAVAGQSNELARHTPVRTPRYAFAAAAALAALVPAGILILSRGPSMFGGTEVLMLATQVGEIRSVKLSDGSKLTLDTATKVEVELSRSARKARLKSGRVRFEVAEGARPFVVEAGSTIVEIGKSVVDIDQAEPQIRVAVIAGTVDVRQPAQHGADGLRIAAGQAVTETRTGLVQQADLPAAPDWTHGMLQFDGTPISAAVALANRYSDQHIVVDSGLSQLRVTGAFRAGDTQGLAKALSAAFDLSLRHSADGNLILSSKGSAAPRK